VVRRVAALVLLTSPYGAANFFNKMRLDEFKEHKQYKKYNSGVKSVDPEYFIKHNQVNRGGLCARDGNVCVIGINAGDATYGVCANRKVG
jgi:septum formation inhibitor MinC